MRNLFRSGLAFYYMAHKVFGGWIIPGKFYAHVKIANELWYYSRCDDSGEKQTHLFFLGWYDRGPGAKMFSCTILWVSIQIALPI